MLHRQLKTSPRALDTILDGGLVVEIRDGLFALIFQGLILGIKPLRVFQSVASGVPGRASYEGGSPVFSNRAAVPH